MVRRWGIWQVLRYLVVVTGISIALLATAAVESSYSRIVRVTTGSPLARPTAEPADDVLPPMDQMSGLTEAEVEDLIQRNLDARLGRDFTRSFDVDATVHDDHSVTITEDIVQVFRTERHGIERTVALRTNEGTNLMRSLTVSTSDGTPGNVSVSDIDGGVLVRIGDPNRTIAGTHAYRLTYVLENVVDNGGTKIRLDAISQWDSRIHSLSYRVTVPGKVSEGWCYLGSFQSDERCGTEELTATGGRFAAGRVLSSGEGLTVDVNFVPSTLLPAATITSMPRPFGRMFVAIGLLFGGLALGFVITVIRARRSMALAARSVTLTFDGPSQQVLPTRTPRGSSLPPPLPSDPALGAPVEFVPPLFLDPASMLRLRDGARASVPTMLAATLVDLAADGVVGLERAADGDRWSVRRLPQPPRGVTPYEQRLLTALLGDDNIHQLDDRAKEVGTAIPAFVQAVDTHLHELGLIAKARLPISSNGRVGAFVSLFAAGIITVMTSVFVIAVIGSTASPGNTALVVSGAAMALMALLGILHDRSRSAQYTDRGRGTVHRITGFERFFRDSEAVHAQAAGNLGLYREYMGYAVAFDYLERWLGSMPSDVTASLEAVVPAAAITSVAHYPMWNLAHRQYRASTARASSHSSIGRGGGFSGGGFSGGGHGGGGGGSW